VHVIAIVALIYGAILLLSAAGFAFAALVDFVRPSLRRRGDSYGDAKANQDRTPPAGYPAASG
jgi:hypothetical protein